MLAEFGVTMKFTARIQGGAEFSSHAANPDTMTAIADAAYDIVNLQGYYEGLHGTPQDYSSAAQVLYDAAHNVGSDVLFEEMWGYHDPGGPQFPAEPNAIETVSQQLAGSFPVQIMRAWNAVSVADSSLFAKLYADSTHQSKVGEYLNILAYTRFFTGQSIQGTTSIPAAVSAVLTPGQVQTLKTAVDGSVDIFYQQGAKTTATIAVSSPTEKQIFDADSTVTFTASAADTASGDLSAQIKWVSGETGELLYTGATFQKAFAIGDLSVIASVTGSDGKPLSLTRRFTLRNASGLPPVAADKSITIPQYEPFRQVNLTALVTSPDYTVAWNTLALDTSQFHGTSGVIDGTNPSTVDFDYAN